MRRLANLGAAVLVGVCAATAVAVPARAATVDTFDMCVWDGGDVCLEWVEGSIEWYNRTARVWGEVVDYGDGFTTGTFEAFAGDTEIDSTTRSADDNGSLGNPRYYDFVIGDPDLRGGINRIKIQACNTIGESRLCSAPIHEYRDR